MARAAPRICACHRHTAGMRSGAWNGQADYVVVQPGGLAVWQQAPSPRWRTPPGLTAPDNLDRLVIGGDEVSARVRTPGRAPITSWRRRRLATAGRRA
jgi:hypothetical protein